MTITNNYFPDSLKIPATTRIRVYNLESRRSERPVPNQFVIRFGYVDVRFQSYDTTCLVWDSTCKVLTVYPEAFGYSNTTSKYSRQFLEDEIGLTSEEVNEVKRLAKSEDFGHDCPLYIELESNGF